MNKLTEDQQTHIKTLCNQEDLEYILEELLSLDDPDATEYYTELGEKLDVIFSALCDEDDTDWDWVHGELSESVVYSNRIEVKSETGAGFIFDMALVKLEPFHVAVRRQFTATDANEYGFGLRDWAVHTDTESIDLYKKWLEEWLLPTENTDLSFILKHYGPKALQDDPIAAAQWLTNRIETLDQASRDSLEKVLPRLADDVQKCAEQWTAWESEKVTFPDKSNSCQGHWGGIGSYYKDAQLSGKNFDDSVIWSAHLVGADLSRCSFKNASFVGCNFCNADLSDADLEGATMTNSLYNKNTRWPHGFDPAQVPADATVTTMNQFSTKNGLMPIDWSFYRLVRHVQERHFLQHTLEEECEREGDFNPSSLVDRSWNEDKQMMLLELGGLIEASSASNESKRSEFVIPTHMYNAFIVLNENKVMDDDNEKNWFVPSTELNEGDSGSEQQHDNEHSVGDLAKTEFPSLSERLDSAFLTQSREACWPRRVNPLEYAAYLTPDMEIHDVTSNWDYTHDYGAFEDKCVALLKASDDWLVVTFSAHHSECTSKFNGWGGIDTVEIHNSKAEASSQFFALESQSRQSSMQPVTDLVDQFIVLAKLSTWSEQTHKKLGDLLASFVVTPDKFRQRSFVQRSRIADMKQDIVDAYCKLASLCRQLGPRNQIHRVSQG